MMSGKEDIEKTGALAYALWSVPTFPEAACNRMDTVDLDLPMRLTNPQGDKRKAD